jgi:hypothetical protein
MPIALASVDKLLIRKGQNRIMHWVDAYRQDFDAKDAQLQVQAFTLKKNQSHRRLFTQTSVALD